MPGKEVNFSGMSVRRRWRIGLVRGGLGSPARCAVVLPAPVSPTDPSRDPSGAIVSTTSTSDKQRLAALFADSGQGGALNTAAQLEMSADADHISQHESEALETESRDARAIDARLATDLRRGASKGRPARLPNCSELGERPRLPARPNGA